MAFCPNGQLLASGYYDRTIRLWDVATGTSRVTLKGHTDVVGAVAFSPDAQILASGSEDNTIILWNPVTGASRRPLEGHSSEQINSLAFSTDGQTLASASYGYIRLWDVTTCAFQATFKVAKGTIESMIFSSDSQLLASAYYNIIEVWDIKKRTLIQQNEFYRGRYFSFNHDGSQLDISGRLVQITSSLHDSAHEKVSTTAPYAMDDEGEWVTYKGCNILRLPHDRRPNVHAFHKNSLVLGGSSGRVTLIQFSSTVAPPFT